MQWGYQIGGPADSFADYTTLPISFTSWYAPMAILHDNTDNHSCRIVNIDSLSQLHVHRGGSINGWFWMAVGN